MHLAIFDLCGTLYSCNTLFAFTRWICPRAFSRRLADSYLGYLADELFPSLQWRKKLHLKTLLRFDERELAYYGRKFVREILPAFGRISALTLLEELQKNSWVTVLVSAAPHFLAEPVARNLGFYEWRSSVYENGTLSVDLTGRKEEILKEFAPWERLLVCTDNRSDEGLLRRADDRLIYVSKRNKSWWLKRFCAEELREV